MFESTHITLEFNIWYPTLEFIMHWILVGVILTPISFVRVKQCIDVLNRRVNKNFIVAQILFILACIIMPLLYIRVIQIYIRTYRNKKVAL